MCISSAGLPALYRNFRTVMAREGHGGTCAHLHKKLEAQPDITSCTPPWLKCKALRGIQTSESLCACCKNKPTFVNIYRKTWCLQTQNVEIIYPKGSPKCGVFFCITENLCLKLSQREVLDFLHCCVLLHVLDCICVLSPREGNYSHWAGYLLNWTALSQDKQEALAFFRWSANMIYCLTFKLNQIFYTILNQMQRRQTNLHSCKEPLTLSHLRQRDWIWQSGFLFSGVQEVPPKAAKRIKHNECNKSGSKQAHTQTPQSDLFSSLPRDENFLFHNH